MIEKLSFRKICHCLDTLGPTDKVDLRNGKSDTAKESVRGKTEETQLQYEWQLIRPRGKKSMFTNLCVYVHQPARNKKK